ncbi:MAG: hypothetical protein M1819_005821 [Sarea resinae]|nr:MAG: hypothetical protein M1819_005821 [Sarea resinae]
MAPFGILYSYVPNARILKIQAAARLNNLELELAPDFAFGQTNRSPEFLAKFPLGKVPALTCAASSEAAAGASEDIHLVESDAIAQFVAESGPLSSQLLGAGPLQRAQIRQWISFASGEVMDHVLPLVGWRVGMGPYDAAVESRALAALERALGCLEAHLKVGRTWLATSEKLSLADLSLASSLYWAFMQVIDQAMREKYPRAVEWYRRTVGSQGVKDVFGEPIFVEQRKEFKQ